MQLISGRPQHNSPPAGHSSLGARPPASAANAGKLGALPRVSSSELLAGSQEIEIAHAGSVYRLRLTSLGKLILTK